MVGQSTAPLPRPGGTGTLPAIINLRDMPSMHLSTLDHLPGYRLTRSFGLVQGSTVRSKHLGRDFMAGLKTLVGGELRGYTELMEEARTEALARMMAAAEALGANAVVGLRFGTASITDGASEMLAYGTAVTVVAEGEPEAASAPTLPPVPMPPAPPAPPAAPAG